MVSGNDWLLGTTGISETGVSSGIESLSGTGEVSESI